MTKLSYDYAATFEGRTTQNRIAKLPSWLEDLLEDHEYSPFVALLQTVSPPKTVKLTIVLEILDELI